MATPRTALAMSYQNANHDTLIISVVSIFTVLSFSALMMRLASKRIKRMALDWDDYLVIIAWVSTVSGGREPRPAALTWKLDYYAGAECRCCLRYIPVSGKCPDQTEGANTHQATRSIGTQFAGLGHHALAVGPAKVEAFLKVSRRFYSPLTVPSSS